MEMDEDIDDFAEEVDFMEASEIDWDYEFDAAQFYDFSRPETLREAQEAERWFSTAGNYPASPLTKRLKRGGGIQREQQTADGYTTSDGETASRGSPSKGKGREGVMETKTKSVPRSSKQWSSTLMKPTLSHLAKLTKAGGDILLSNHFCGRFQKSLLHVDERSSQNGFDDLATKRQKLEIGYLCKDSLMKHQALLLHKKSKKDPNAAYSKLKVTIPKEPALETLQRAKNRRSRTNSESSERSDLETQFFKANTKIFKPPSPTPTVKSKQKLTEIQAFNLKTTARALQRSSATELNRHDSDVSSQSNPIDWKRSNFDDALKKEKNEKPPKTKAGTYSNKIHPTKEDNGAGGAAMESELQKDKRLSQSPPTELFKKLSLKSELGNDTISQPKTHSRVSAKGSKENAPDSFQPDFWRCVGKMNQCGSVKAIPGIADQSNVNRSLGIR